MKHIEGLDRDQIMMVSFDQFVHPEAFCRIIDAFVDAMDLQSFDFKNIELNNEGRPPYHPGDLLKLYLYGYQGGLRSSRKLEHACEVNLEVMWLLKGKRPHYKTISEFRREHKKAFVEIFRTFVLTLKKWKLVSGKTIAVDSFKIRAQNSLKNNFNKKKINRQLKYIDKKIENYLAELEESDNKPKNKILKDKINFQETNKKKYCELLEELTNSSEEQISLTDPDSRAVVLHRKIVNVGYNIQAVSDGKHKMLVALDCGSPNDTHDLAPMVKQAQENLNVKGMKVLADKGYHTGEQLSRCEELKVTTYVSPKANAANSRFKIFPKEIFKYHPGSDTYRCPNNEILRTNGKWSERKGPHKRSSPIQIKYYGTKACKTCPIRSQCTSNKLGRKIQRTEYQPSIDRNNRRVNKAPDFYRQRQQIIEHQFGTFKRQWGFTHVLMREKENVKGEIGILFTAYNLRRSVSILGFQSVLKRLRALIFAFFSKSRTTATVRPHRIESYC